MKLIIPLLLTAGIGFASAPLGTVSSEGAFTLDGKSISVRGVMSWPLLSGDIISTSSSAALISFQDGSTVSLLPNSILRVTGSGAKPIAVLESGALDYDIHKNSQLSVTKLDDGKSKSGGVVDRVAIGTVIASSLAGGTAAAMHLTSGSSSSAGSVVAFDPTPSLTKPPPLSRFQ